MTKGIFSGLEDLGFDNIENVDLFKKEDDKKPSGNKSEEKKEDPKSFLYLKKVNCPVCGKVNYVIAVKTGANRVLKRDSDTFIRYDGLPEVNPYFYDVWICNFCGYSAMKSDFLKLRSFQIDLIKKNISPKWKGKEYPDIYDAKIAIERYKLSLLNYYVTDAKSSQKAMNCLKLAWMYRLLEKHDSEIGFLKKAVEGFKDSYYNEDFPIYGMDRFTIMYMIGELSRRIGNNEDAIMMFSQVITTPGVSEKIKEQARTQKDILKEDEKAARAEAEAEQSSDEDKQNNKKGFFSKLFK